MQETGTISQAIPGFTPGINYTISFLAAERLHNARSWNVTVDGAVIASFNPGTNATSYVNYYSHFQGHGNTHTSGTLWEPIWPAATTPSSLTVSRLFVDNVRASFSL